MTVQAILLSAFARPRHSDGPPPPWPPGGKGRSWSPAEISARGTQQGCGPAPAFARLTAAVALRVPHGTLCLSSAANLHGMLPGHSGRTWLAIVGPVPPGGAAKSARLIRWTFPGAFTEGIEDQYVAGVKVRITCPARTVVDLFRYAHRLGGEEAGLVAGRAFLARGGPWSELQKLATVTGAPAGVGRLIRFLRLYEGEGV